MEKRIAIKVNFQEKEEIQIAANALKMTVSELMKRKVFGISLLEECLALLDGELKDLESKEIFTLKEVLEEIWGILSKGDKKYLKKVILKKCEEGEIKMRVHKETKKGKIKFIKL